MKNKHDIMVLVHDTSSECALQMYGISSKYLGYQDIEQTQFCDGQTDKRMQGEKQYVTRHAKRDELGVI